VLVGLDVLDEDREAGGSLVDQEESLFMRAVGAMGAAAGVRIAS